MKTSWFKTMQHMEGSSAEVILCQDSSKVLQWPYGWSMESLEKVMRSDETIIDFFLVLTLFTMFELGVLSQEHHTYREACRWKHYGLFFRTVLRTGWTGLCFVRYWDITSFPQSKRWRRVVAGSSNMTTTQSTQPGKPRIGSVTSISRFWSGLASFQY